MRRQSFLRAALGLGVLAGGGGRAAAAPMLRWQRRTLLGFGTTLSLQAGHEDEATLERALDAAVGALRRIEAQMSLFGEGSALSRLNRDGVLAAPPAELLAVLRIAQGVSQRSGGAFDVTVQPLWLAFEMARRGARLPDARELLAARARVGWRGLELSPGRLRLARPGMAVTLNGIAQGYAVDQVRAVLARHGIRHALIDAGEFAMLGHNPQGQRWTLGIADPRDEQALLARLADDGRCIATSADNATTFSTDRRHHHIFDPHTGMSPPDLASVLVAAPSCTLADALTKVLFVVGWQNALVHAAAWGVDALVIHKSGHWQATPGLRLLRA